MSLMEKINIVDQKIKEMKVALDLDEDVPLDTLVENVGKGGTTEVVNGVVDTNYFSTGGEIQPNTFIKTSVVSNLTALNITGTFYDSAPLDNDHFVVVTRDGNNGDVKLYVFSGTTLLSSVIIEDDSTATVHVCTAEDGVNIFALVGGLGYGAKVMHYTFNNGGLAKIAEKETEGKSSNYYMYSCGITYFKKSGTTHTCLIGTKVDDWCYCGVAQFTGSSITCGSLLGLHDNHNYSIDFGGFAVISSTKAITCCTNITNSYGNVGTGAYILTVSGTTITKTALSGSPTRQPRVFKVNDSLVVIANRFSDTASLVLDKYTISGSSATFSGTITVGTMGSTSPYFTDIAKINDNNFLIMHTYYDSSTKLKYCPCTVDGTNITLGTEVLLNQSGSNFKRLIRKGTNAIQIHIGSSILLGILNGLSFTVGVKYVSPATSSIDGITKTLCSESVAGEIWKL